MSLLPTTIPNVATGFNTSSISPLFKQLTSGGIQSTAGFENLLGNLKSPGDPSNFSWLQRSSAKLNNIFSTLNKGLGNAATKAMNNATSPLALTSNVVNTIGGGVADSVFGNTINHTSGYDAALSAVQTGLNFIPGVGPLASMALGLGNTFGRKTYEGTSTDGIQGQLMAGLGDRTVSGVSRLFNKSKNRHHRRRSNYIDNVNIQGSLQNYLGTQNQLAAGNTSQYLGDKNILNLQGGMNQYNQSLLAKKGGIINPAQLRSISQKVERKLKGGIIEEVKEEIQELKDGGKVNVIPEGALHARLHDLPEEIADQVTKKGIPVVTEEEGGKLLQHAEIERDEIIFRKEATDKIEELHKKYKEAKTEKEKNKIAIECGKYLTDEILFNTEDNTGLLGKVGENGK